MKERILCVDDEPNVLRAYQRALRRNYSIDAVSGGGAGIKAITDRGPYAVVVSDMRMPGMDGIEFLSKVKDITPTSIRIMLTGNNDQKTAIDAVNQGNIFRFLTKPCSPETLGEALQSGLEQYRLAKAEKELLEKTLRGSVQVLSEVLSLVNPTAFGRSSRLRPLVKQIANELRVHDHWQVEVATMLSQIGCVVVPEQVLTKVYRGARLSAEQSRQFQDHYRIGRDLIARIPRMEAVAEIIYHQDKHYDGSGVPDDGLRGQQIPLGARILKIVQDFDRLVSSGMTKAGALKEIEVRRDWYDPDCVVALKNSLVGQIRYKLRSTSVSQLTPDMRLAADVFSMAGVLMVSRGQEVTPSLKGRLEQLLKNGVISDTIKVLIPA